MAKSCIFAPIFAKTIRMKKFSVLLAGLAVAVLSSCIRDEAASVECDILSATDEWMASLPSGLLLGEPTISGAVPASVVFRVSSIDQSQPFMQAPQFNVSQGATLVYPDGGDASTQYDFRESHVYQVVSEDGKFTKEYTVSFEEPLPFESCDFEDFSYDNDNQNYQVLLQREADGNLNANIWASGNAGFKLTGMATTYEDYPTCFVWDEAKGSRVAKLETRDTGNFGMKTNPKMPIAAGNLFIGEFRIAQAMLAPRKATRFGWQIVKKRPVSLSGEYKYTAGAEMLDKNKNILENEQDTADIYAVVYEVDPDNVVPLNGDDILSSERIVLMARIADPGYPTEWTTFEEPFEEKNGKTFSAERLANNGYALSVVMTSSRRGAYFEGAVGSVLYVDNIRITWQ